MPYNPELLEEIIKTQNDFVWEVPAWEERNRGPRWYLLMSVVAIAFVIYAVVTSNFLFAFIVLLAAIILVLTGHEKPHTVLAQIGMNGVVVDGKLYEFKDINDFSIIYKPPETKVLYLEHGSFVRPRVRIPLEDQDPVEIRNHLKQFIREDLELQDEHASDILARLLRL